MTYNPSGSCRASPHLEAEKEFHQSTCQTAKEKTGGNICKTQTRYVQQEGSVRQGVDWDIPLIAYIISSLLYMRGLQVSSCSRCTSLLNWGLQTLCNSLQLVQEAFVGCVDSEVEAQRE